MHISNYSLLFDSAERGGMLRELGKLGKRGGGGGAVVILDGCGGNGGEAVWIVAELYDWSG